MNKDRKTRIAGITKPYDVTSISFEQILLIIVIINKTTLDIGIVRKLTIAFMQIKDTRKITNGRKYKN